MKNVKNTFLPFFMCFSFQFFFSFAHANAIPSQVCHQNDCITVEVVSKQEDMERGLMYRPGLDPDKGMLFVFTYDDRHPFWMKNMHFNLDTLWISFDGRIVYIGHNMPACRAEPCAVYVPNEASRYVLELNSGFTDSHHWKVGDKLDLSSVLKK